MIDTSFCCSPCNPTLLLYIVLVPPSDACCWGSVIREMEEEEEGEFKLVLDLAPGGRNYLPTFTEINE